MKGIRRCPVCYRPHVRRDSAYCETCQQICGRIREIWSPDFLRLIPDFLREEREARILAHQERVQAELQRLREGRG